MSEEGNFKGKIVKTSARKRDSLALTQGKPVYVADLSKNPLPATTLCIRPRIFPFL